MKKVLFFIAFLVNTLLAMAQTANVIVKVVVQGIDTGDKAIVSISSESFLKTEVVESDGTIEFTDVPTGLHSVKIEALGYNIPDTKFVNVNKDGSIDPIVPISLVITKQTEDTNSWNHLWKEDGSVAGYTQTSYVNKPVEIEWLGKMIVPSEISYSSILQKDYNIILVDDEVAWTQEYAYRLFETIKTIPCSWDFKGKTVVTLTSSSIDDDISVTDEGSGNKSVVITTDAFVYANPFLVNLDGVRGKYYSKRLHHAMVNYVTNFGKDTNRVNTILKDRFGCQVQNVNYSELTKNITNEDATHFQPFLPTELVSIINMLEELPEGFHKTEHLNYLIRRQNGIPHPLYPEAAAVSWPVDNGYIEFMENAFGGNNTDVGTLRLILHEKTHFLWEYTFSEEIKNDWIELGGWYKDPNHGGWSTTKTTEFVSAYAHAFNPNEDMAESVAHYLKNPELLQSRSLPKYEFIRDRIMHGVRYVSKIPDHLTFEVLNLYPDYDYPGKITELKVNVKGGAQEDKTVTVEIRLNDEEGYDDGASGAYVRIYSPSWTDKDGMIHIQSQDIGLSPVNNDNHYLRGRITISKYSKSGYWTAGDIVVSDIQGNQRFEGQNDCIWNCYINNALEDLFAPEIEDNSLSYELTDGTLENHPVKVLSVKYKVKDDVGIKTIFARVRARKDGEFISTDQDGYGVYDAITQTATVNFYITEFYPTADYYAAHIATQDLAGTNSTVDFYDNVEINPRKYIHIETSNPDYEAPTVDVDRITIYAEPTHPEAPDGETKVTINYYVKDNKSGFGRCYYSLKDPQGIVHSAYHYHRNFDTKFFNGDPTVWEKYTTTVILPRGSAPGIWGLSQLDVYDKAMNRRTYNFVETMIFEPDNSNTDYELFTQINEDKGTLSLSLTSNGSEFSNYDYRIINDATGEEISGTIGSNVRYAMRKVTSTDQDLQTIDISSLGYGKIVVLVYVKDAEDKVLSVKTQILNYIQHGNATAISSVEAAMKDGSVVYTLDGKRVNTMEKGKIYIVDGVKMIVK